MSVKSLSSKASTAKNKSEHRALLSKNHLFRDEDMGIYNTMINHIGDELFLIDRFGNIVFVNEAAVQGLGYTHEYIFKKTIMAFLEKKVSLRAWQDDYFRVMKKLKTPMPLNMNRKVKGGGDNTAEMTAMYMPFRDDEFILITARDVTERVASNKLRRYETESEKLKALQIFIAGSSQELRRPLMGVLQKTKGLLDNCRKKDFEYIGYKDYENILKTIEGINSQIKYCYDTTERLININRKKIKSGRRHCRANQVIQGIIKTRKNQFNMHDIHVKVLLRQHIPPAAIGDLELTEMINNVLNNAVQAMPHGGLLTIRTKHEVAAKNILIVVKDEGGGISKDNLKHIFDPFFTTKQRGLDKNSGLGLAIVQSLIKTVRGSVKISSRIGQGTTVSLRIPVSNGKSS